MGTLEQEDEVNETEVAEREKRATSRMKKEGNELEDEMEEGGDGRKKPIPVFYFSLHHCYGTPANI